MASSSTKATTTSAAAAAAAADGDEGASAALYVTIKTTFLSLRTFKDLQAAVESIHGGTGGTSRGGMQQQSSPMPPGAACEGVHIERGKRVLCVWDVDDTLVASDPSGVRQCPVFDDDDLIGLFRRFPARHLLLSQGSIDDVFWSGKKGGRLQYLTPFFLRGENATRCSSSSPPMKAHAGCSTVFGCLKQAGLKLHNSSRATENCDTHIIRIATLRAPSEQPEDHRLFLSGDREPPRCSSDVRWLVMRPSLWGISLASLSNFIAPSANTAFLDGSVFRKMDVVRSLAASGFWDVVFFMDNNLSEVGVVRPGLGVDDYYRMKSAGRLPRFFHSDLLLLKVSAALAEKNSLNNLPRLNGNGLRRSTGTGQADKSQSGGTDQTVAPCGSAFSPSAPPPLNEISNSNSKALSQRQPGGREVNLVVAHLHLDATKFRQVTKARVGTVKHQEREWWHPTLTVGQTCTDDHYAEMMTDFLHYEALYLQEVADSEASVTPLPGWEPSIAAVRYRLYERPQYLPNLRIQYTKICHQIMTDLVEPTALRVTEAQEYQLKSEANNLYRRLVRRQPVVDPLLIVRIASTLFIVFTAEHRLPRNISATLKKEIKALMEDLG